MQEYTRCRLVNAKAAVPVDQAKQAAVGMEMPGIDTTFREPQGRSTTAHVPQLEAPGGPAADSEHRARSEAGFGRLAQLWKPADFRVIGHAADGAVALVCGADIQREVVVQLDPDRSWRQRAEFLRDVDVRQRQGGNG